MAFYESKEHDILGINNQENNQHESSRVSVTRNPSIKTTVHSIMTSQSYLDVFFQVMDGDRDVLTTSLKKRKIKSNN